MRLFNRQSDKMRVALAVGDDGAEAAAEFLDDHARVHARLDRAFHDQGVAVGDLDAFELDVGADNQATAAF